MNRPRIHIFQPSVGAEELAAVAATFETNWIGRGPKVAEFERAWAEHIGINSAHMVSVSCATEGLFQICQMLLAPGDEVIIPSIHFVGAVNAVLSTGAQPIFCDVDSKTLNATLEQIAPHRSEHTKAVIILHYGGVAQNLYAIRQWCDQHDIVMIEDAACAQATRYENIPAGYFGHFSVWSFDAMKIMTCGDGGMIFCWYNDVADRLRKRLYLGLDMQSGLSSEASRWWEYSVTMPGRRAVMNDIAASIGLEQLKKLPDFVRRRRQIVGRYDETLSDLVRTPPGEPYYFYWIQTERRDALAHYLREHGIYTTFRYYPLHRVFGRHTHLPGADYAADHTLLLPLHQGLTDDDVQYVIDKTKAFFA